MKETTKWIRDNMITCSSLTKVHEDMIDYSSCMWSPALCCVLRTSCVTETMIFTCEYIEADVKSERGNLQNFTEGTYEHSKNVILEQIKTPQMSIFFFNNFLNITQFSAQQRAKTDDFLRVDVSSLTHSLEEFTDVWWWKECGEPFRDNISPKWFRSGPATLHFRPQVCNRP